MGMETEVERVGDVINLTLQLSKRESGKIAVSLMNANLDDVGLEALRLEDEEMTDEEMIKIFLKGMAKTLRIAHENPMAISALRRIDRLLSSRIEVSPLRAETL